MSIVALAPTAQAAPRPRGLNPPSNLRKARAISPSTQPTTPTYYIAPTGNDGATGDSGHPFRHIQHCADVANPGDTCMIRAGTYRETVKPARSGAAGNSITYRAEVVIQAHRA